MRVEVKSATLLDKDHEIQGTLTNGTDYEVKFPDGYTDTITKQIVQAEGQELRRRQPEGESRGSASSSTCCPSSLIILVVLFFLNQMQGGGSRVMNFGKSRAKPVSKDQPKVTFKDVAGLDEAIEELERDPRLPRGAGQVPADGRQDPEGRAAVRPARHGQDPARQGGRRRGGRAVLLDLGLGLRRDVRRRRRVARCATCSSRRRPRHPRSSSSTRSTRSVATAVPASAAVTTSASRR